MVPVSFLSGEGLPLTVEASYTTTAEGEALSAEVGRTRCPRGPEMLLDLVGGDAHGPLPRLSTLELGPPLLPERGDALLRVLGHEDPGDRLSLQCEPQVERRGVSERSNHLGPADRLGRSRGQLRAVVDRRRAASGGVLVELIHYPQLFRVLGREGAGVGDQVNASGQPDEPRKALGAAGPREEAQV